MTRRRVDETMRESEELYRSLVEAGFLIVWTADAEGRTYRSAGWAELTGQPEERAIGAGWLDAIHPDDRVRVEDTIRREQHRAFEIEYRLVRKDGTVRWVRDRGFPIRDENGQSYRAAGIAEDITERKEAEENLRKSVEATLDLYNRAPCGYHSLDENGVYVQVNDTELSWLGLTREEVIGKLRFIDVLTEESRETMREEYPQFLEEGSAHDIEYQIIGRDGSTRFVLLSATAARDDEGNFLMSRATLYDMTERKQAEEAIRESEEKFARAFRSSPVAIAVTRVIDGKFVEVNQALEKFLGYRRDELIGRTTVELRMWLDLADRHHLTDELLAVGSVLDREIPFRTKQGEVVIADYSAELIEIGGEQCLLSVLLDITERRYMEGALKTNEALLKQFVKHTPAAIAMFDTEMRYLQVSDRFLTDYELEGQDIIGRRHYEVFPDLPERWREVHRRILAGATESCDEDPYVAPDGSQGWLQWESLPWRTAGGEIGGLILFTQVITARKRAEQAVRASEERFAKSFNLSPYRMGIVRISDGVILDVNDCWVRDTGFSREETVNHQIYELDRWLSEDALDRIRTMLQSGESLLSFEGVLKTKSGEQRVTLSSAALVDFDGEPCYLWAANDITDRKRAEEELQRSEERYRTLFETAPDAVVVFDSDLQLVMTNERGAKLYGFERAEELTGTSAYDFVASEDRKRVEELISRMQKTGKLAVFECTGLRRDGTRFDLETRASLIPTADGQAPSVLTVKTDITERKRAETALRNSEEQLRALSAKMQSMREEEGTRIAREIHDELGGALTGLKWDLEKIDGRLRGSNGDVEIADVRKQIGAMTGLIESTINTVRRISSELRPGVLDDLGLVAAIEWQGQQFQSRTGINVHWETTLEMVELSLDGATAVFRIFQEVLTNVLRHSQATNVYVKLHTRGQYIELDVRDDGRGITDGEKGNTRSLGLLGMKERALLVGGEVEISGAEGRGTRVVVRVPLSVGPSMI